MDETAGKGEGQGMELLKLANYGHYYHTHSDFFNHPLDLVQAFLMKNYEIGMHEQEFYEINVVTKGKGVHYINNNRISATEGDVFIIPPNNGHGYVGGEGFDVFHVILSEGFMNKYVADLQQLPSFFALFGVEPLMRGKTVRPLHLSLSKESLAETLAVLEKISSYINYQDSVECIIRSSLAMIAIGILCKAYTESRPKTEFPFYEDRALMESISFIHEHYFEKITMEDLTRIAHISRSSYIKKFKNICKMTPSAYITKIRMDSAAIMLSNTSLSIADIALRTGFYDASHFTKTFESHYQISPVAYRNKET